MPAKISCSWPLLPLSPLPTTSSFRMLLGSRREQEHKLQSSSEIIHRRSRSCNILHGTLKKISNFKHRDENSTMSLCSVTSDESYDHDDTIMDASFDDTIECDDGRSNSAMLFHPISLQTTFPRFTRGNVPSTNFPQESCVVTPPTPSRLTLKMRPSSFLLPFTGDEFYAKYDDSEDYSDDDFVYTIDEWSRVDVDYRTTSDEYAVQPNLVPSTVSTSESIHNITISESVSYDENDENEYCVPSTPPSRYQDGNSNPRFISSPPMIRLIPKRVAYLPFHSHDNYNYSQNGNYSCGSGSMDNFDNRTTVPSFNHDLHHLLLPDDF